MLPVFGAIFIATSFIGEYVVLALLGLNEGDLWLMERGIAGWTAEILFTLVLVSAPVAGAWLAATALRHGGRWGAWLGLVLNALLILFTLYMFVDAILMTYYPQLR
jgi:hypothetical protein